MSFIQKEFILDMFQSLNSSGLNYILLRNIDNELPSNLIFGKDIDILINKTDEEQFASLLKAKNFINVQHPHKNDVFLYGANEFKFFKNNHHNLIFDLNFELVVRSLDQGQWIPLDQEIQESAWQNRRLKKIDANFEYWTLSYEDEFISLISRAIFDKSEFPSGYSNRIIEIYPLLNKDEVEKKLNLVFFNYTDSLLEQVEKKEFKDIKKNYLQFTDY